LERTPETTRSKTAKQQGGFAVTEIKKEEWRPVVGYEGIYEVSDRGRVRSMPRRVHHPYRGIISLRGRFLRLSNCKGYFRFDAYRNGAVEQLSVHAEVLKAFVGPKPAGCVCCHRDGNKTNNVPANLRWDTQKANNADKIAHGTYAKIPASKLDEIRALRATGLLHREIGAIVGVSDKHVGNILSGRTRVYG
jgi:hypothetical protein